MASRNKWLTLFAAWRTKRKIGIYRKLWRNNSAARTAACEPLPHGLGLLLEQTATQRGVMSLTCFDVRVSDRTKAQWASHSARRRRRSSAQPDLWHRWDEKPQWAISNRNRFASSTSRKRGSLVVSNFVAKATTGDN